MYAVFESQAIIATQVLGNGGNVGNGRQNFNASIPTKTADVQLFGARPTWSAIAEDPAATLGAVWQAELQDLQNVEQDGADNQVNDQAAQQVKQALDKANQGQGQQVQTTQSAEASTSAAAEATASA